MAELGEGKQNLNSAVDYLLQLLEGILTGLTCEPTKQVSEAEPLNFPTPEAAIHALEIKIATCIKVVNQISDGLAKVKGMLGALAP